jgi:hypothetical protein
MRLLLAARVLCMACLQMLPSGSLGSATPASPVPTNSGPDFGDFLIGQSLVVEGTVTALTRVNRTSIGGCGIAPMAEGPAYDVQLSVSRVRSGTAEDSALTFTTLFELPFPRRALRPGAHILAWCYRNCRDGWRLWGGAVGIAPSGRIVGYVGSEDFLWLRGAPRREPLRYATLDSTLNARSSHTLAAQYDGAAGIALVRVVDIQSTAAGGRRLACDSLGWVLGVRSTVPAVLELPPQRSCYSDIQPGDSLLVPTRDVGPPAPLVFDACPYGMQVKYGYARGFGVPLPFLSYAVKPSSTGLRISPFLRREP